MSEKSNLYLVSDLLGMELFLDEESGDVTGKMKFQPSGFDFVYTMQVEDRIVLDVMGDVVLVLSVGCGSGPKPHLNLVIDVRDPNEALLTLVSKAKLPKTFKKWSDITNDDELYSTIEGAVLSQYKLKNKSDKWKEIR
jgi:hypothetical protein